MDDNQLNQLKLMGKRIRENRQVLDIPVEEMARCTGVSVDEYIDHESGKVDSSFTFLYHCAERFGIDISQLVTGESPKLSFYTLTRNGGGMPIKRRSEFEYRHLAPRLKNRQGEPFMVRAQFGREGDPIALTTHTGQEFDYVLEGRLRVQLGDKIEVMNPGDSIFYDSGRPHGMVAADPDGCVFLAIVLRGEGEAPVPVPAEEVTTIGETSPERRLLYHDFVDETLDKNGHLAAVKIHYPDNYNFAYDVIDELARRTPDKVAMIWLDRHRNRRDFTFADIAGYSGMTANYFASLGIRKGDRVMLVLRRHYQFWFAIIALHRIGAIAIPASNQLVAKDFKYRFKQVGVKAVVCSGYDRIAEYVDEATAEVPVELKVMVNGSRPGWHDFNAEFEKFGTDYPRPADQKATDPTLMFFSSGTTGFPKAVEHSHTYSLGHALTARWWHNVEPEGLHLTISDTGWGKALWGKLYGQWLCEAPILVYDFDRFAAGDILTLFKEFGITTFCAPPTMYRFFIKEDLSKFDLSSLKYATIAGEALNPEVFQQFYRATGIKLMEGFGQTETTLVIGNLIGMTPKPGSMGKPSPLYTVELFDHDDKPVKSGEVGEIVIRTELNQTPGIFLGYFNAADETKSRWYDGWYHTGDTAWRDEDGYYWYVGRIDDLIKSSGYRIGPFEIESVLMELPYVLECAVVGVPDPDRGQLVKAFIVLTGGKQPSDELKKEIQNYVKSHTAPYKYPRKIQFVEALPKTTSGKIRRTELRKMVD